MNEFPIYALKEIDNCLSELYRELPLITRKEKACIRDLIDKLDISLPIPQLYRNVLKIINITTAKIESICQQPIATSLNAIEAHPNEKAQLIALLKDQDDWLIQKTSCDFIDTNTVILAKAEARLSFLNELTCSHIH